MSRNDFTGHSTTVSGWGLHTFTPISNGHGPYSQRYSQMTRKSQKTSPKGFSAPKCDVGS